MPTGRRRTTKKPIADEIEISEPKKRLPKSEIIPQGTPQFKVNCKFKSKKQKEMHDTILNNRITFVRGAPGTGKAQPLYCKVLTPDGWKSMGDMKLGDEILTPDNKISYIDGVFPQGIKDIYKIIFSDNTHTFSCDEHLWAVKDEKLRNKRLRKNGEYYKPEMDFKILSLNQIKDNTNIRGRLNFNIPMVDEIEFKKKNTKISPYLMGLLLGDASFRNGISYSSNDEEIQNYIENEVINYNCKLSNFSQKNDTKYFNITGYKQVNNLLKIIKEYELYNTTSDTKFIPSDYINSTINDRKEILAGLLDTDGYIDKRNGVTYFYTVSEKLKDNVSEIVNSLGGTVKITTKIGKYTYNGEKKQGKLCYSLCLSLNFNPFKLKRKSEFYQIRTKYKPIRYIKHVEYVGKEDAQCISINDPKHLYITDNYIVTHNTLISLLTALECIKNKSINIDQIVLTKPIVEITSSRSGLGALPGDINEKTLSYYMHFYDNLTKLIGTEPTKLLKERGVIKDTVLNFLRGSTFGKWDAQGNPVGSFCIFDESQNCSPVEMKTFISRMGEESKLVIMGDSDQIDLKLNKGEKCGLDDAWDRLQGVPGIGFIEFTEDDIVRDPFLIEIMKRYKQQ